MRFGRSAGVAAGLGLVALAPGSACARRTGADPIPVASLASSKSAEEAFRPLRQRWVASARADRGPLEPNLVWFLGHYPGDDLAQIATVYLAWIAIDHGDAARARELIAGVLSGPSGTTKDLAEIAEAAILRRNHEAARALERLEPLVGKMIDPYARELFDEELVRAAMEAGRWFEGVAYMDTWLQVAPEEDHDLVRAQVDRELSTVPDDAVRLLLETIRSNKGRTGYGDEIKRALARRLEGDGGDATGEALAVRGPARVDGRTIGLLVSAGGANRGTRTRGADAVAGVMEGLELPRAPAGPDDGTKLVTRDDGGDPARTPVELDVLASEGAAVVVAGVDAAQASAAAAFAARTGIPVVLLVSPDADVDPSAPVFTIAGGEEQAARALAFALAARGAKAIAPVGPLPDGIEPPRAAFVGAAACSLRAARAGERRFPVAAWRADKVDAVLLLGDDVCSADALDEALGARLPVAAGVGLQGAELAMAPVRARTIIARAGSFPLVRGDAGSPLSGWLARHGSSPTWTAALARDAAVLARAAATALPEGTTEDPAEVARRHAAAAQSFTAARRDLWTTGARGFERPGPIAREVEAVELR